MPTYTSGQAKPAVIPPGTPLHNKIYVLPELEFEDEKIVSVEQFHESLQKADLAIIEKAKPRIFDSLKRPPEAITVLSLAGVSVGRAGGLSVIQAKKKSGKTASLEGQVASMLSSDSKGDFLGWTCEDPNDGIVLHFDCEQSERDHWEFCQRVYMRAGVEPSEEKLKSYCMTGWSPEQIKKLVNAEFKRCAPHGIRGIVFDGFGDLVLSVNEEADCNATVAWLMRLAAEGNTHVSGVLHLNPGSIKSRGHLGSHLERKAETIIEIARDEKNVATAFASVTRKKEIAKKDGARFMFDESMRGWVSLGSVAEEKSKESRNNLVKILNEIWSEDLTVKLSHGDLKGAICKKTSNQPEAAKAMITKMTKFGLAVKITNGNRLSPYELTDESKTSIEAMRAI